MQGKLKKVKIASALCCLQTSKMDKSQVMVFFYPSMQRHYHRLIYYLYYYIATCFGHMTIIMQKIY
jgi:hypothetical protein